MGALFYLEIPREDYSNFALKLSKKRTDFTCHVDSNPLFFRF